MIPHPSSSTPELVQVVPLLRVRSLAGRTFDYRLPPELEGEVGPGDLVVVPFARRKVRGVVWALGPSEELAAGRVPLERVLSVLERADERISPDLLALAERLSDHALAPLGACLQAIAPPASPKRTGRLVTWVLPALRARQRDAPAPADVGPAAVGEAAVAADDPAAGERPLTSKQRLALDAVPPEGAPLADLVDATGVGRGVFAALVRRGALRTEQRRVSPGHRPTSPLGGRGGPPLDGRGVLPLDGRRVGGGMARIRRRRRAAEEPPLLLTDEQAAALDELITDLDDDEPRRRVLWGVTGSGKTEVYLRLLDRVVAQRGRSDPAGARDRAHHADGGAPARAADGAGGRAAQRPHAPAAGRGASGAGGGRGPRRGGGPFRGLRRGARPAAGHRGRGPRHLLQAGGGTALRRAPSGLVAGGGGAGPAGGGQRHAPQRVPGLPGGAVAPARAARRRGAAGRGGGRHAPAGRPPGAGAPFPGRPPGGARCRRRRPSCCSTAGGTRRSCAATSAGTWSCALGARSP